MEPEKTRTGRPVRPWATLTITLLAVVALVFPTVAEGLIYDRSLILQGQAWRAWTGHVVHFGRSHLVWDLVVFLPAGCWLESLWPKLARWFYAACPLAISALLLGLDPALLRYAGLSGLATGVLVLLAVLQIRRRPREAVWLWVSLLTLVAVKIGIEWRTGTPLLVTGFSGIRSVPLAHLGGAACGALLGIAARSRPVG